MRGQRMGSSSARLVDGHRGADDGRVRGRAGRVVAAARVDLDVAEAALGEVRLEGGHGVVEGHVGHQAQVELGDGAVRQHGLAARPGVAGDQALDVHGGREQEALERGAPGLVVGPAVAPTAGAWRSSSSRRAAAASSDRALGRRGRADGLGEASIAGSPSALTSVASACTRWNAGLSSRARLLEWTSFFGPRPHFSPLDTSSSSTTPLAPSDTVTVPSGSCDAAGMKTPVQRLSAALTSGRRTT